jgi:hypothetical protein
VRRCSRRISSSSSWASAAGAVGLIAAACSGVGYPSGKGIPCGAASVSATQPENATSICLAWTCSSSPQERSSSIVRVLTPVARGSGEGPSRRSTTSEPTP